MANQSPRDKAEYLVKTLEQHGQGDYIGESISQLEHCLQAAHHAQKSGARNELIIAALLHDIGQIIPLESTKEVRMNLKSSTENVGRIGHERIGSEFLRSLGFSRSVCQLVESHVAAKRYLTAVDLSYYDSLSSASKKSLEFQGGPFRGADLVAFEQDPLRDEMVALRLWDDAAKVPEIEDSTPRVPAYLDLIVAHLEAQEVGPTRIFVVMSQLFFFCLFASGMLWRFLVKKSGKNEIKSLRSRCEDLVPECQQPNSGA